ncbi:hypothetical protein OF83DRAFT_1215158 [Amylostereum chailletii]|nr:hypothetical protein OF83DRAFT_1215158 [Amylostereum chailletii]
MFRYVISSASDYFYLPIDDETLTENDGTDISHHGRHISWRHLAEKADVDEAPRRRRSSRSRARRGLKTETHRSPAIAEVLAQENLYEILGVAHGADLDKMELRRAYLSRSKACHPDKFPDDPEATFAFQKVSVAYNILSNPLSKRRYDAHPAGHAFASTASGAMRAEETLRSVVTGVFNDFLDGDLEMVRTLLRAMNDINPALRLGEEGIDSILLTLQALPCRALTHTVLTTLSHLVDTHASLAQLSYLSVRPRARLTVRLARITLALPLALERSMWEERRARARSRARRSGEDEGGGAGAGEEEDERQGRAGVILPRRMALLIEGVVVVLEKMEGVL